MYLRAAHADLHMPTLRDFIKENPLGLLTTGIASPNFPFLQCSHLPWLLDVQDDSSETELGTLRGHLARANPHSKAIIEHLEAKAGEDSSVPQQLSDEVMILFNGPVHHYVTPKFYVQTKPATGKVVPTWDYSAVQAYGRATVYFNSSAAETADFLSKQVSELSQYAETKVMGYDKAWQVSDAPTSYIELMRKAIIGVEVKIDRLEGKFKMSQELAKGDRQGVIEGFGKMGNEYTDKLAETVRLRGDLKDSATNHAQ